MRTLRSLMIGDTDHYFSPYTHAVAQGVFKLGHWHSQVSIRQDISTIDRRICDVRPDVIWTHMLLWAPVGSPPVERLIEVCRKARRQWGSRIVIHDGDYKPTPRRGHDLSDWCALALCNHKFDRTCWQVPVLYWPYCAFSQNAIAHPSWPPRDLFFAGNLGSDPVYADRTRLVEGVRAILGDKLRVQRTEDGNTLFRTAEVAVACRAVLGFGRPGTSGWVDTRVFQYPGAGAILIHDDAGGFLTPGEHYLPYVSGSAESAADTFRHVEMMSEADQWSLRERAYAYVQEHHSSVARVRQVLDFLFGGGR